MDENFNALIKVCTFMKERGKRALLVGGAVRDMVLGLEPKDMDVEVYGCHPDALLHMLQEVADNNKVNAVGKSFGVLKCRVDGVEFDISCPRRENKVGRGHKGFLVEFDPTITPEQAALRRDFTMNAMAFDPLTNEVLDFFGGRDDLRNGILRHTSDAFAEDSLRVLRGFQFAGRFELDVAFSTMRMMRVLHMEELPLERVWEEWQKWATKSKRPSAGLILLEQADWLPKQLMDLITTKQDPEWHPEGNVFMHTLQAVDAAVGICYIYDIHDRDALIVMLAVLCHDMGKPGRTQVSEKTGHIISPGHNDSSNARTFLEGIGCPVDIMEPVLHLVEAHMAHIFSTPSPRVVRRLSVALQPATIRMWAAVVEADHSGRQPLPGGLPKKAAMMLSMAVDEDLENTKPSPKWMGRHLMERGMKPGVLMGEALRELYEAQLDGRLEEVELQMGLND